MENPDFLRFLPKSMVYSYIQLVTIGYYFISLTSSEETNKGSGKQTIIFKFRNRVQMLNVDVEAIPGDPTMIYPFS
jgi:hypothetical protein